MTNIWRQKIEITDRQTITGPGLRRVLAVDNSRGDLDAWGLAEVWFEVVPGEPDRSLDLIIVGTGHKVPDDAGDYIGHLVASGGLYIWHFYTGRIFQGEPR